MDQIIRILILGGKEIHTQLEFSNPLLPQPITQDVNITDLGSYAGIKWKLGENGIEIFIPINSVPQQTPVPTPTPKPEESEKVMKVVELKSIFDDEMLMGRFPIPRTRIGATTLTFTKEESHAYLISRGVFIRLSNQHKEIGYNKKVICAKAVHVNTEGYYYVRLSKSESELLIKPHDQYIPVVEVSRAQKKKKYFSDKTRVTPDGEYPSYMIEIRTKPTNVDQLREQLRKTRMQELEAMREK